MKVKMRMLLIDWLIVLDVCSPRAGHVCLGGSHSAAKDGYPEPSKGVSKK